MDLRYNITEKSFQGGNMKKFLVFLISIVVVVSFGLVTYYFLRNDEVINFKTTEIYCNVGDIVTINDLGKTVKKQSNKTKYNYNAAGDDVVSAIKYNDGKGYYVAQKGGDYEVVISTTNKKFKEFKFTVHIGDGSESNPYFVKDEQSLNKIGNVYSLSSNYVLTADVLLSNDFKPIGYDAETSSWLGFSGVFNGNNHTITGSTYNFETENAGLFYSLNGASIKNLTLKSFKISGDYSTVGVLAGSANNSAVSNVSVDNSTITNTQVNGIAGGLIGTVVGNASSITTCSVNNIELLSPDTVSATVTFGGFVGKLNQGSIRGCLSTGNINVANDASKVAGFVGEMVISSSYGTIQQSYSVVSCEMVNYAGFVHTISTTGDLTGVNYLKYLIGNYAVVGAHDAVKEKPAIITTLYDETKGVYGIKTYNEAVDMKTASSYVYYAIEGQKEMWDSFIWKIIPGNLPTLYTTNLTPSAVSSEYFLMDNDKHFGIDTNSFIDFVNTCRTTDGKIKDKYFVLNSDIDLAEIDWKAIDLENSIIDGKGHKISNLKLKNVNNGSLSFFGTVNNSTIKNIVFENVSFEADAENASVVANVVKATDSSTGASNIEGIEISFNNEIAKQFTNFASIANQVVDGSAIKNCTISNLTINADTKINNVASVVNTIGKDSRVVKANINASLKAQSSVAGVANTNNGSVLDTTANISINHTNENAIATIAGLVGVNKGEISKANLTLSVNVEKSADNTKVAGVTTVNSGNVSDVALLGSGISASNNSSEYLYIAGFACENNGKISSSKCEVEKLGTYNADKRHYVAGIAVENSGNNSVINQVVVTSEINGNTVAGAVVKMNNASAKIEQIVIGAYNFADGTMNQNLIKGDRFVAGVVLDLRNGSVANVQTSSQIYGTKNSTVSSFVALIFPNGASFKKATINSSFNGYGKFYSECWQDFRNASSEIKAELNYQTTGNSDRSFDILDYDASAGSFQSVIINETAANKYNKQYQTATFISEGVFFGAYQWPSYEDTDRSSFFKFVGEADFKKVSTYKGSVTMTTPKGLFNWGRATFTKQCQFDFDSDWTEVANNGIALTFLLNM